MPQVFLWDLQRDRIFDTFPKRIHHHLMIRSPDTYI